MEDKMTEGYNDDPYEKDEIEEKEFNINYDLSSYGIDFDVSGLVRRLQNESIYLPDFQRNYVWSKKKASRFIESLLLGLPIPSICLYKEDNNKQLIIDGFQRLETIKRFYEGQFGKSVFSLSDVRDDLKKKRYKDLDEDYRRKLDDTLIHATIVKAEDPTEKNYDAIYLIFERLNTGGVNLSPQEIRVCIHHGSFQKIIEQLSKNINFIKILDIDNKRKKDQEVVLRLLALAESFTKYSGNMKQYLNEYMFYNKNTTIDSFKNQIELFNKVFDIFEKALTLDIFKPSKVVNLAITDAIFCGTYHRLKKGNITDINLYKTLVDSILVDKLFIDSIKTGKTHHTDSIHKRIQISIDKLGTCK